MAFWPKKPADEPVKTTMPQMSNNETMAGTAERKPAKPLFDVQLPRESMLAREIKPSIAPGLSETPEPKTQAAATGGVSTLHRLGEITSILMRSPAHKALTLAELEQLVVPALASGQFTIAEGVLKSGGGKQPMAAVLWARVSDDIDQLLLQRPGQPIRLKPIEWTTGDNVWIVEAAGEGTALEALLKRMMQTAWVGKTVKLSTKGKDGEPAIGTLTTADTRPAGKPH